ncbi:beta-phosphoglucomutase-like phosphatase (HAD superfamily) [Bifidobacterium commune]|uniref:Haloacid dehalogenase superfamily, subfamily IA, variant 3 with third motif having DD or ED n=1 Tax=Bifidobacterium commune TaxID=1505727 RepID=A0A1C4H1A9_9BIFI|nr:HAD family phosphatase [Bifidobacterium commune]MBB2954746.1 beta-phosphoglucomutase-like phosphatase (HAD superfamily) [Bifidobacterium commune]SCC78691.1 haloacid dehalogenase superfamily, subfamily IA, variant 3 with third motif having DD or ED [Bifidobacterium commune]
MGVNDGKAAIFDLDGTLLDSMGLWSQIDIDFFESRHIVFPEDYGSTVASMSSDEVARYTIERFHLPDTVDELNAEWERMAVEAYASVGAKPHAKAYLAALKASGAKLAVATALTPHLRDIAMRHVGIADIFDAVVSLSETHSADKNNPAVYLSAAQLLDVEPEHCVVFEDLLDAMLGAKAAGMHVWAMADDFSTDDLPAITVEADGVIWDFSDAPKIL